MISAYPVLKVFEQSSRHGNFSDTDIASSFPSAVTSQRNFSAGISFSSLPHSLHLFQFTLVDVVVSKSLHQS